MLDFQFNVIVKVIIAILSGSVSVISSMLAINNSKELWIRYRSNCEILKSLLHRYYTNSKEFNLESEEEQFQHLVEISEQYLTKEFIDWASIFNKPNQSSINS